MKALNLSAALIVCIIMLPCLTAYADDKMTREPLPGEKIEKTHLSDEEIRNFLTGEWKHKREVGVHYTIIYHYDFNENGTYTNKIVISINGETKFMSLKGEWELNDGIVTLSSIERDESKNSQTDETFAYKILVINKIKMEWQIDPERTNSVSDEKNSETIILFERADRVK